MTTLIKQREPRQEEEMMGLNQAGLVLFPETETVLDIPFINGKYNIGLNEDQKKLFETYFNITFDSPAGEAFLEDYKIVLSHDINAFSKDDIEAQFKLAVLKANKGMGVVRFTESDDPYDVAPFVATTAEGEIEERVNRKSLRNDAIRELQNLMDKSKPKLIKAYRYLFDINANTDAQLAYDKLDEYIMENLNNAENFLKILRLDPEYVDSVITVKAAIARNIIRLTTDKWYVNYINQTKLGRNIDEIVKFLTNPQNQDQMGTDKDTDSTYSIKRQLKESLS